MTDFSLSLTGGNSDIRRSADDMPAPVYEDLRVSAGLGFEPWALPFDAELLPLVEAGYGRTVGDATTAGSNRHQGSLGGGLRLTPLRFSLGTFSTAPFVGGQIDLAVNRTQFGFGAGTVPLPTETDLSAVASGRAGLELCLGGYPCLSGFWAPFYERGLAGEPAFIARATGFLGAEIVFPFLPGVPFKTYQDARQQEEKKGERITFLEGQRADLRKEKKRLERENRRLRKELEEQADASSKAEADLKIARRDVLRAAESDAEDIMRDDPIRGSLFFFDFDSAAISTLKGRDPQTLKPVYINPQLESLVAHLKAHPSIRVMIHGHADQRGSEAVNKAIAMKRAQAVKNYLLIRGVPPNQIAEMVVHGYEELLDPNDPESARNRCIRFTEVKEP